MADEPAVHRSLRKWQHSQRAGARIIRGLTAGIHLDQIMYQFICLAAGALSIWIVFRCPSEYNPDGQEPSFVAFNIAK